MWPTYDADDRLVREIRQAGTAPPSALVAYVNDENGNRIARGTAGSRTTTAAIKTITLVSLTTGGGYRISYAYTGDGHLARRDGSGSATDYLLDVLWPVPRVAQEIGGSGRGLDYVLGPRGRCDLRSVTATAPTA